MWEQPCPHRSGHSLDVAVVEGAVVVHLQREHRSTGIQGTRDSPAATTQHESQGGSEHSRPQIPAVGGPGPHSPGQSDSCGRGSGPAGSG